MENLTNELSAVNYIKDEELELSKTQGNFLSLKLGENTYKRVMLQRAFPLSMPTKFISVRDYNTTGLTGPLTLNDIKDENWGKFLNLVRNLIYQKFVLLMIKVLCLITQVS